MVPGGGSGGGSGSGGGGDNVGVLLSHILAIYRILWSIGRTGVHHKLEYKLHPGLLSRNTLNYPITNFSIVNLTFVV